MSSLLDSAPVPIALGRVDDLLAKTFAVAAAALSIDVMSNGFRQLPLLNQPLFYLFFSALMISLLGSIAAAFWLGNMRFWYRAILFTTLATLIAWPLQVVEFAALPADFKPWIWWAVGFASLAATGAFKRKTAIFFLVVTPLVWLALRLSPFGASDNIALAVEDTLYSFLFSSSVSFLVMFLRDRASQVDREFWSLSKARLERAFLDILQIERTKVNSIVHDSVIASLDAAAEASTDADRLVAAKSATVAITRLQREAARDPMARDHISSQALFESLSAAIERRSSLVQVKTKLPVDLQVPFEVAVAIAEATFQALNNSLVHAPGATSRKVTLSSARKSLKVVVVDNGPGFRMSSVPRNRLGVRLAIFKRLETLGVAVHLKSSPGEGATWVFEWSSR